jgi:hypothetical protein
MRGGDVLGRVYFLDLYGFDIISESFKCGDAVSSEEQFLIIQKVHGVLKVIRSELTDGIIVQVSLGRILVIKVIL